MAHKPATPGTGFVGPLYLLDKDLDVVATIAAEGEVSINAQTTVQRIITTVDASGGGSAQTTAIGTIPAGSLLLSVRAVVVEPFDGDATETFEVGVSGNIDAYIDTADFAPESVAGTAYSNIGGTTNDIKVAQYLAADTPVIATWTNTDDATAGAIEVTLTYLAA